MFVLGNFLKAIANVLSFVLNAYVFVLILDAVLSFIPQMNYSPFRQVISSLANLVLNPLRRLIKPIGQIDFTPYIAILIIIFLNSFLVQTLFDIGAKLR
ncbi:MAG TPA: YggT family protein [Thermotogota bacterium]|nr:YggT family protein [Thermotogota bacterium]HRW34320.1 YggT family protein [Thermotogota bacterium]